MVPATRQFRNFFSYVSFSSPRSSPPHSLDSSNRSSPGRLRPHRTTQRRTDDASHSRLHFFARPSRFGSSDSARWTRRGAGLQIRPATDGTQHDRSLLARSNSSSGKSLSLRELYVIQCIPTEGEIHRAWYVLFRFCDRTSTPRKGFRRFWKC